MMTAIDCPKTDRLREYALGQLPEENSDELADHLRDCPSCQSELDTIADCEDSLIQSIRTVDSLASLCDEPGCQAAMLAALSAISDRQSTPDDMDVPNAIGEYEIVRPLGSGGMGNVYLARHTKLGREVAMKVLAHHRVGDPRMTERFEAEMRAIGQLSHPGIVTAHDAREIDGTAVLVTEYIDGLDLSQVVSRVGELTTADACEIIRHVAVALQYTSDQGFVHRDIKPSNIMLSRRGEVKLLDLGLARLQEPHEGRPDLTATGQAMGTADYIAPEQVNDSRGVDVRADIYSLGCTLFKLLTGRAPFADDKHETAFEKMTAHVRSAPPGIEEFCPQVAPALAKLVESMLAKHSSDRPKTPRNVADRLSQFTGDADLDSLIQRALTTTSPPSRTATRSLPTELALRRKVPIYVAVAAGFFGLLLGLAGGMLIRIKSPDGTEVVMQVPPGSEVMIETDSPDDAPKDADFIRPSTGYSSDSFLEFAILATDDQIEEYIGTYGATPDMIRHRDEPLVWYPMDASATSAMVLEHNGQKFHLVDSTKRLAIPNTSWEQMVENVDATKSDRIELRLSEPAGERLRKLTDEHKRRQLAVIVNGSIRMTPVIREAVGREIAIYGKFSEADRNFVSDLIERSIAEQLPLSQ